MSEEEKAIEMIKFIKKTNTLIGFNNADRQKLAEIILNLIEKQQKELKSSVSKQTIEDLIKEMKKDGSHYWAKRLKKILEEESIWLKY